MIKCYACGALNVANSIFCEECGSKLIDQKPASQSSTPHTPTETQPLLHITLLDADAVLDIALREPLLMGRQDAERGITPHIDLGKYGGLEKGVSRRHAQLDVEHGQVVIQDLDSTNGTVVGNRRLTPFLSCPVRNGEQVKLGNMKLLIEYTPEGGDAAWQKP